MPAPDHASKTVDSVPCAIVTVSDTRTPETDKSGALTKELLSGAGHTVHSYNIVKDDPPAIRALIEQHRDDPSCTAILITGGTGLSPRDGTYEVVASLLDKRLDGFGELFRTLSYDDIGPAAMLSRALAGTIAASGNASSSTIVFSMPGSTPAVRLAMQKLILPELPHIAHLINEIN